MGFFGRFRQAPPSPAEFAARIIAALRAAGDTAPVRYDAYRFALIYDEDEKNVTNLQNLYMQYRGAAVAEHPGMIEQIVAFRLRPATAAVGLSEARQRLLPSVRPRSYGSPSTATAGEIGKDLVTLLVLDFPREIAMVNRESLAEWGIDESQAATVALANLRARTEGSLGKVRPGVFGSRWIDNYDATRILLPEVVRGLPVRGRLVALLPHRDSLLVTGEDDVDGLRYLAREAEASFLVHHRLSVVPLVLEGELWRDLELPHSHPVAQAFSEQRARSSVLDYEAQKTSLTAMFEREGRETFVATLQARKRNDGRVKTLCVWTKDVEALLPFADVIVFTVVEGSATVLGFAPWADVQRVAGSRMQRTEDEPVRWRVASFPEGSELAAMGLRPLAEL